MKHTTREKEFWTFYENLALWFTKLHRRGVSEFCFEGLKIFARLTEVNKKILEKQIQTFRKFQKTTFGMILHL